MAWARPEDGFVTAVAVWLPVAAPGLTAILILAVTSLAAIALAAATGVPWALLLPAMVGLSAR